MITGTIVMMLKPPKQLVGAAAIGAGGTGGWYSWWMNG
jgi:hypothetical protein